MLKISGAVCKRLLAVTRPRLPEQKNPLPAKPSLQVQMKPPAMLEQFAWAWQGLIILSAHSSKSVQQCRDAWGALNTWNSFHFDPNCKCSGWTNKSAIRVIPIKEILTKMFRLSRFSNLDIAELTLTKFRPPYRSRHDSRIFRNFAGTGSWWCHPRNIAPSPRWQFCHWWARSAQGMLFLSQVKCVSNSSSRAAFLKYAIVLFELTSFVKWANESIYALWWLNLS